MRARALALAATIVVLTGASLAFQFSGGPPDVAETLLPLVFAGLGPVIAIRAPRNPIGWLFLGIGLLMSAGQAGDSLMFAARDRFAAPTVAKVATVATGWMWLPSIALQATFCLLLFPDGRLPGPRWRWVALLAAVGTLVATAVMVVAPFLSDLDALIADPYGDAPLPAPLEMVLVGGGLALAVAAVGCVASLFVRWRRAVGVTRQQLKWFAAGAMVQVFGLGAGFVTHPLATFLQEATVIAIPAATTVAIARYRLYEIDRIISRTVTYALLTAVLIGTYLGAVTVLTAFTAPVAGNSPLAVAAATLLAAAASSPARRRIQAAVDHRFNRARYDAVKTADAYRARLRDQLDLETITADLVATTRTAVQPDSAAIWLRPGDVS